jgi:hypothetical protein
VTSPPPIGLTTSFTAGLALLLVRGLLLWLVVPMGFLVWVFGWPYWFSRQVELGAFLGWLDLNTIALLQRTLLRPLFRAARLPWTPLHEAAELVHCISFVDPA